MIPAVTVLLVVHSTVLRLHVCQTHCGWWQVKRQECLCLSRLLIGKSANPRRGVTDLVLVLKSFMQSATITPQTSI